MSLASEYGKRRPDDLVVESKRHGSHIFRVNDVGDFAIDYYTSFSPEVALRIAEWIMATFGP